jgi:hypothetical protein
MTDLRFTESADTIPPRLARLKSCSITELKQQWRTFYGSAPPHRISRELLMRAVAYRIQERVYGGLKPSTRRLLIRLADQARSGRLKPEPPAGAQPGTVLMREWHGVTHEVRVLDRQPRAISLIRAENPQTRGLAGG